MLEAGRAGPLPVADRLELRRLADALCHALKVTYEPPPNTSRVDAAVSALKRFRANLKRRTGMSLNYRSSTKKHGTKHNLQNSDTLHIRATKGRPKSVCYLGS